MASVAIAIQLVSNSCQILSILCSTNWLRVIREAFELYELVGVSYLPTRGCLFEEIFISKGYSDPIWCHRIQFICFVHVREITILCSRDSRGKDTLVKEIKICHSIITEAWFHSF